jgi:hypothetical protein
MPSAEVGLITTKGARAASGLIKNAAIFICANSRERVRSLGSPRTKGKLSGRGL